MVQLSWQRRLILVALVLACLPWLLAPGRYPAVQADRRPAAPNSVFGRPALAREAMTLLNEVAALAGQGRYAEAEAICRRATQVAPFFSVTHYRLAAALAMQGKTVEALDSLDQAVEVGFRDAEFLAHDPFLNRLRDQERFAKLLAQVRQLAAQPVPRAADPRPIVDGVALVTERNAAWDERQNLVRTYFEFPPPPAKPAPVILDHDQVGVQLREWFAEGTAAGHAGDLYDNHDHDHSNLKYASFPQLARIEYDQGLGTATTFGPQLMLLHGGVVFGNASTAMVGGPYWRSNPRLAYVDQVGAGTLFVQYVNQHLYCYPEHQDYDAGHNGAGGGYGDVYPANTPYVIISQGSSGSDGVFLDALACTLAAFRPEVKQRLVELGMLMPTVQMIFRRSNRPVVAEADYLTGIAHPTVFDGGSLRVANMIELAHEITPDTLPPLTLLEVVEEDRPLLGRDYFHHVDGEAIFTTPCAIARVYRTTRRTRRMVVSAAASRDANSRPLAFHWVVLRGDAEQVKMTARDGQSSVMELEIGYQPRRPIAPRATMESNRIDIGVFAHNGAYYSPPSFITLFTLDNEERVYDAQDRIQSVTYRGALEQANYVDPYLDVPKSWRDDYQYDTLGRLLGWTRTRGRGEAATTEFFTADGARVIERDGQGRPLIARTVRYVAETPAPGKPPVLVQQPGDTLLRYRYANAQDLVGEVEFRTAAP